MTRKKQLAFGWIAILASGVLPATSILPDYEKERQLARANQFQEYVEHQHFSLHLEFDGDGRITVRKAFLGPHSRQDLLCEDKPDDGGFDFLPQARFDLYFVALCLTEESPELKVDAVYEEGLRKLQERMDAFDLPGRYDLTRADLVRLEPWAQSYLNKHLKRTGLYDFLVGGWKRHALNASECYQAKTREWSSARLIGHPEACDLWPKLVGATRFCGPDPANLVFYTSAFLRSREQRAVGSLDKLGLRECLGNLLAYGSEPDLIDAFGLFGFPMSSTQQDRANSYAWEVWRSFHVDEWLERTAHAGAVPRDVETTLTACAHGTLPAGAGGPRVKSQPDARKRIPPPGWGPWEWDQEDPSSPEALLEDRLAQFTAYSREFWITDVTVDANGVASAMPSFSGPHNDGALFCEPPQRKDVLDFRAQARSDLPVVLECLRQDVPALDPDAIHRTATADAESGLREALRTRASGLPTLDILELQSGADARLTQMLDKSGLYDLLTGAWRRHVAGDSECYRTAISRFDKRKREFLDGGGGCDAPEQLIGLMPVMKPDLLNYVVFYSVAPGPVQDALERLQKSGLRLCLGQILDRAGDRDTMAKLGMLQQYPSRFRSDRAAGYAWNLWRRYGLDNWILRTSEAGEVPADVASVVAHCATGEIPQLGSGKTAAGRNGSPSGSP